MSWNRPHLKQVWWVLIPFCKNIRFTSLVSTVTSTGAEDRGAATGTLVSLGRNSIDLQQSDPNIKSDIVLHCLCSRSVVSHILRLYSNGYFKVNLSGVHSLHAGRSDRSVSQEDFC